MGKKKKQWVNVIVTRKEAATDIFERAECERRIRAFLGLRVSFFHEALAELISHPCSAAQPKLHVDSNALTNAFYFHHMLAKTLEFVYRLYFPWNRRLLHLIVSSDPDQSVHVCAPVFGVSSKWQRIMPHVSRNARRRWLF